MQHVHVSALAAVVILLSVVVTVGTANLAARSHPNSTLSQAWLLLF